MPIYNKKLLMVNYMKKIILVTLLLLGLNLLTLAQEYEYGKPAELKALTKVFIDTELDVENRNRIVEEIEKAKLDNINSCRINR